MNVATPVKQARISRGLSQKVAAEAIGFDQGGWSRIERGQQAPAPEMVYRIAALLGLTADDVLQPFKPADLESPEIETDKSA